MTESYTLLRTIENIDNNHLILPEPNFTKTLLFVSSSFDTNGYANVLDPTIEYVLSTKRLEETRFQLRRFQTRLRASKFLYLL